MKNIIPCMTLTGLLSEKTAVELYNLYPEDPREMFLRKGNSAVCQGLLSCRRHIAELEDPSDEVA